MRVSGSLALAASNARKVVSVFRAAGAISGSRARHLADLRLNNGATFRELIQSGVLRKAGADRYFLDENAWAQRRQLSARMMLRIAVPVVLVLLAVYLYWAGR